MKTKKFLSFLLVSFFKISQAFPLLLTLRQCVRLWIVQAEILNVSTRLFLLTLLLTTLLWLMLSEPRMHLNINMNFEFESNEERYRFLRWAQTAFDNFRAVPPATGIVHQVNLEYLASVAATKTVDGETVVYPDSLVGTDSHTTMINGLGVVGWGVGGIEAEAGMLGQPLYFVTPEVVGFKLTGNLAEGATATDLALTVTQILRKKGVVGKFVEFYGPGLSNISLG